MQFDGCGFGAGCGLGVLAMFERGQCLGTGFQKVGAYVYSG